MITLMLWKKEKRAARASDFDMGHIVMVRRLSQSSYKTAGHVGDFPVGSG